MKENPETEAPKPSDFWRDLLQMQLMLLRDTLPPELKGIIQFKVSDGITDNCFFMTLDGSDSTFQTGEAPSVSVACTVETTELQVSQVLFVGIANLLDMNISGDRELFEGYVQQAAKMKEALK